MNLIDYTIKEILSKDKRHVYIDDSGDIKEFWTRKVRYVDIGGEGVKYEQANTKEGLKEYCEGYKGLH